MNNVISSKPFRDLICVFCVLLLRAHNNSTTQQHQIIIMSQCQLEDCM